MTTAVLTDGLQYAIPSSDMDFFKQLAKKMGWTVCNINVQSQETEADQVSWADEFAGKWQDIRTAEQIVQDIHQARTINNDIIL